MNINSKPIKCNMHDVNIDRICTNKECVNRLMCMLCQHNHIFLANLFQKSYIDYKKFLKRVEESIDTILSITDHKSRQEDWSYRISKIQKYFRQCIAIIIQTFEQKKKRIIQELQREDQDLVGIIKELRISKKYHLAKPEVFQLLLNLYSGNDIQQNFEQKKYEKLKSIDSMIEETAGLFKMIMENLLPPQSKISIPKTPELINITTIPQDLSSQLQQNHNQSDISQNIQNLSLPKLSHESNLEFQSIITDTIFHKDKYFVTSMDKSLKILDSQFNILREFQYNNTLERIHMITDQQFALAISKEIAIMNISQSNQLKQLMKLRGHQKKIVSLDNLNSRILGSCSGDSVKIWDLYKQNQEYFIRDKAESTELCFVPFNKKVIIGYNDWKVKYYDVETLKLVKNVKLPGIPLCSSKLDDNVTYFGGYPNNLSILDFRSPNIETFKIGQQAITCFQSYAPKLMIAGNRTNEIFFFDIRNSNILLNWKPYKLMNNWSRPNGILKLFCFDKKIVSVSAHEKKISLWVLNS